MKSRSWRKGRKVPMWFYFFFSLKSNYILEYPLECYIKILRLFCCICGVYVQWSKKVFPKILRWVELYFLKTFKKIVVKEYICNLPFGPFLSVQFNGIKYVHIVGQTLPSMYRAFLSSPAETPYPLNNLPPFPALQPLFYFLWIWLL